MDATFEQRTSNNEFWADDETLFKWQQFDTAAATRVDAVNRQTGFKTLGLSATGQAATECTLHNADGDAALNASDLTYTCPSSAFFSRFQFDPANTNNSLQIRCCKRSKMTCHAETCATQAPFTNGCGDVVVGCRQVDEQGITQIVFEGASTEVSRVKCCKQVPESSCRRTSDQLDVRSTSEFVFQRPNVGQATVLTGFTHDPKSAHA